MSILEEILLGSDRYTSTIERTYVHYQKELFVFSKCSDIVSLQHNREYVRKSWGASFILTVTPCFRHRPQFHSGDRGHKLSCILPLRQLILATPMRINWHPPNTLKTENNCPRCYSSFILWVFWTSTHLVKYPYHNYYHQH